MAGEATGDGTLSPLQPAEPVPTAVASVVMAEFEVRPERMSEFLALASRFAAECLAAEPGCRRFDVVALSTTASGVLFYEIYNDDTAFAAHGQSPHLARFKAAFPPLIVRELGLRRGQL